MNGAGGALRPFQLEGSALRGRHVRLEEAAHTILSRHDYPPPVARLLAEALAIAALLAGALKYDGVFTLQIRGDGPVRMLVADVTSAGAMRGYAQVREGVGAASLAQLPATVPALLGAGHLAFTVDQGAHTDRYQGIVELAGAQLADCAQSYFRQSEQLRTGMRVAAARAADGCWAAAALMLQQLPPGEPPPATGEEDDWRRAMILLGSVRDEELLDGDLAATDLLYRLFHEEGVRVFTPKPLQDQCRCSEERVLRMLASLDPAEVSELARDGAIDVTCEFCSSRYSMTEQDAAAAKEAGANAG